LYSLHTHYTRCTIDEVDDSGEEEMVVAIRQHKSEIKKRLMVAMEIELFEEKQRPTTPIADRMFKVLHTVEEPILPYYLEVLDPTKAKSARVFVSEDYKNSEGKKAFSAGRIGRLAKTVPNSHGFSPTVAWWNAQQQVRLPKRGGVLVPIDAKDLKLTGLTHDVLVTATDLEAELTEPVDALAGLDEYTIQYRAAAFRLSYLHEADRPAHSAMNLQITTVIEGRHLMKRVQDQLTKQGLAPNEEEVVVITGTFAGQRAELTKPTAVLHHEQRYEITFDLEVEPDSLESLRGSSVYITGGVHRARAANLAEPARVTAFDMVSDAPHKLNILADGEEGVPHMRATIDGVHLKPTPGTMEDETMLTVKGEEMDFVKNMLLMPMEGGSEYLLRVSSDSTALLTIGTLHCQLDNTRLVGGGAGGRAGSTGDSSALVKTVVPQDFTIGPTVRYAPGQHLRVYNGGTGAVAIGDWQWQFAEVLGVGAGARHLVHVNSTGAEAELDLNETNHAYCLQTEEQFQAAHRSYRDGFRARFGTFDDTITGHTIDVLEQTVKMAWRLEGTEATRRRAAARKGRRVEREARLRMEEAQTFAQEQEEDRLKRRKGRPAKGKELVRQRRALKEVDKQEKAHAAAVEAMTAANVVVATDIHRSSEAFRRLLMDPGAEHVRPGGFIRPRGIILLAPPNAGKTTVLKRLAVEAIGPVLLPTVDWNAVKVDNEPEYTPGKRWVPPPPPPAPGGGNAFAQMFGGDVSESALHAAAAAQGADIAAAEATAMAYAFVAAVTANTAAAEAQRQAIAAVKDVRTAAEDMVPVWVRPVELLQLLEGGSFVNVTSGEFARRRGRLPRDDIVVQPEGEYEVTLDEKLVPASSTLVLGAHLQYNAMQVNVIGGRYQGCDGEIEYRDDGEGSFGLAMSGRARGKGSMLKNDDTRYRVHVGHSAQVSNITGEELEAAGTISITIAKNDDEVDEEEGDGAAAVVVAPVRAGTGSSSDEEGEEEEGGGTSEGKGSGGARPKHDHGEFAGCDGMLHFRPGSMSERECKYDPEREYDVTIEEETLPLAIATIKGVHLLQPLGVDVLDEWLRRSSGCVPQSQGHLYLRQALLERRLLVLIDGLHECGSKRAFVEDFVINQLLCKGVATLITARSDFDVKKFLPYIEVYSQMPLDAEQQQELAHQRLGQAQATTFMDKLAAKEADGGREYTELASNIQCFCMMLSVFETEGALYDNKGALYRVAMKAMLARAGLSECHEDFCKALALKLNLHKPHHDFGDADVEEWGLATTCIEVQGGAAVDYAALVTELYQNHNRKKLDDPTFVAKTLKKHAGKEEEMMVALRKSFQSQDGEDGDEAGQGKKKAWGSPAKKQRKQSSVEKTNQSSANASGTGQQRCLPVWEEVKGKVVTGALPLFEASHGRYRFSQTAFQDYFSAAFLRDQLEAGHAITKLLDVKHGFDLYKPEPYKKWVHVIVFLADLLRLADLDVIAVADRLLGEHSHSIEGRPFPACLFPIALRSSPHPYAASLSAFLPEPELEPEESVGPTMVLSETPEVDAEDVSAGDDVSSGAAVVLTAEMLAPVSATAELVSAAEGEAQPEEEQQLQPHQQYIPRGQTAADKARATDLALHLLDVAAVEMSAAASLHIGHGLAKNPRLDVIYIKGISSEAVATILLGNKTLQVLDISGNRYTPDDLAHIAMVLETNK
jgi:hypothetical protein